MSKYRTTMKELLEKVYKEDGHQDVSSSKRMCRTIVEDAQQIESKLNSMSPEDSLDTWWTNKLAVSANNLNKARDYIVNDVKEELEEGKMKTIATMFDQGKSAKEIAKALKLPLSTVKSILGEGINPYVSMQKDDKTGRTKYVVLDKDEKEAFSSFEYKVAQNYMKKNYNKLKEVLELDENRVNDIKKKAKEFGVDVSVDAMGPFKSKQVNVNGFKTQSGMHKFMKYVASMGKDFLTIKEQLDEKIADSIIKDLQKAYGDLKGKTISPEMANKISKHLDGQSFDVGTLRQLTKAKIPFISTIARNKIYKKTGKFEEVEQPMPKEEPKKDNEKKESENKDATIASLKDQIAMLKTKLENEKNKAIKPEPNPDTGEVPLTVGVAYKHFKDKKEKEVKEETLEEMSPAEKKKRLQRAKDMIKYYDMLKKRALKGPNKALAKKMLKSDVNEADLTKSQIKQVHKVADDLPKKDFKDRYGKEKGDAVRFGTATNMVKKKLGIKEDRRLYVETIAGLKKKAEKSGMPYSILKKVYDRGMAAWKSGHRPGASQQQWAFARVNSFVTKSSGTWGGADKDLAKQVRGSK